MANEAGDDRSDIHRDDRVILIVENDLGFARFVLDQVRAKGFKGLVTSMGATALAMAREYQPHAITLDIHLPDIDGWRVLDRLKHDTSSRHIPICVISTDESRDRALASGAMSFVSKPLQSAEVLVAALDHINDQLNRKVKQLLLVAPNDDDREQMLLDAVGEIANVDRASDLEQALQAFGEKQFDCVVVSPKSVDFISQIPDGGAPSMPTPFGRLPVLIYGNGNPVVEDPSWRRLADHCTIRTVHSPERLLDLATFFLHLNVDKLPQPTRRTLEELHESDKVLAGKTALIVDDDMRNIFALSTVLEEHDMVVVSADNGRDAIRILKEHNEIDIVLMDIMMPEMDGMETMREIRKIGKLKDLPIIAVTAKAMKGDREKCIEAGAWDYLAKPVETQQMLSALRAWLYR